MDLTPLRCDFAVLLDCTASALLRFRLAWTLHKTCQCPGKRVIHAMTIPATSSADASHASTDIDSNDNELVDAREATRYTTETIVSDSDHRPLTYVDAAMSILVLPITTTAAQRHMLGNSSFDVENRSKKSEAAPTEPDSPIAVDLVQGEQAAAALLSAAPPNHSQAAITSSHVIITDSGGEGGLPRRHDTGESRDVHSDGLTMAVEVASAPIAKDAADARLRAGEARDDELPGANHGGSGNGSRPNDKFPTDRGGVVVGSFSKVGDPGKRIGREAFAATVSVRRRPHLGRWVRRGFAALLLLVLFWWLVVPLFIPLTSQAVISAQVIQLRAPIDGTVVELMKNVGDRVAPGEPIARVVNQRIDTSELAALVSMQTKLTAQSRRLQTDLDAAQAEKTAVDKELSQYTSTLLQSLELAQQQAQARLAAEQAAASAARQRLRTSQLVVKQGAISREESDDRAEAATISGHHVDEAQRELSRLQTELQAARKGVFLNNAPPAHERAVALQQLISQLTSQLRETAKQLEATDTQLQHERDRIAQLTEAVVKSPAGGIIWQRLGVEGQTVGKTESLYQLAAGETMYVDALIHQRFLNRIEPGSLAVVIVTGGRTLYGRVRAVHGRDPATRDASQALVVPQSDLRYTHVWIDLDSEKPAPSLIGRHARVLITSAQPGLLERLIMGCFARFRL